MSLVEYLIDTIELRANLVNKHFDEIEIEKIFQSIAESSLVVSRVDGD